MATTTNYGWTTPDDTALVKDGAAAIRTLGSSVDTTTKALNPSTTLGDIEYRSSTANTNTRLGIGTTGQVLLVSGGVPAWGTPASGGMTLISETVASANSSISLSSIPNTYKQLILVWTGVEHSAGSTDFSLRFNNDSTTDAYKSIGFKANSSGLDLAAANYTSLTTEKGGTPIYSFGSGANYSNVPILASSGYIIIDNYASTTKWKHVNAMFSYFNNTAQSYAAANCTFFWANTSAITSLDIVRLAGSATISNAANTSIRLYGVA